MFDGILTENPSTSCVGDVVEDTDGRLWTVTVVCKDYVTLERDTDNGNVIENVDHRTLSAAYTLL